MVTKQQAQTLRHFYFTSKGNIKQVRASGQCKVWKTRPAEFKLPIKYGLYESAYITHENAHKFFASYEEAKTSGGFNSIDGGV